MFYSKTFKLILSIAVGLFFMGCAANPPKTEVPQKSNLTVGTAKTKIIEGQTTQAEILEIFGSPNIITKNRDDDEVWNYNRMSFETTSGSEGVFLLFLSGSRAATSSTTSSFDLIITFDENDIVKDYSVISASF